jgi:hypothetical protein
MNDPDFTPEETHHIQALLRRLSIREASGPGDESRALRWVLAEVLGIDVPPRRGAPEVVVRHRAV